MTTEMPEPETMAQVARIHCPIAPYDWPFPNDESARIDRYWAHLRAEKPALFNGRVLLARHLTIDKTAGGTLVGQAFEVAYKSLIGWRDFGYPGVSVYNIFAMPALRSADGAFMLGLMSAGTVNSGKLYFPAGTPEPSDAGADGVVDFDANILRELQEETGLAPTDVALDATWTIVFAGPRIACMKIARSPLSASELVARVAATVAAQDEPELDGLVAVHRAADFDATRMPDFMLRYLRAVLPV